MALFVEIFSEVSRDTEKAVFRRPQHGFDRSFDRNRPDHGPYRMGYAEMDFSWGGSFLKKMT